MRIDEFEWGCELAFTEIISFFSLFQRLIDIVSMWKLFKKFQEYNTDNALIFF